jgi:hypothetical protein
MTSPMEQTELAMASALTAYAAAGSVLDDVEVVPATDASETVLPRLVVQSTGTATEVALDSNLWELDLSFTLHTHADDNTAAEHRALKAELIGLLRATVASWQAYTNKPGGTDTRTVTGFSLWGMRFESDNEVTREGNNWISAATVKVHISPADPAS